MRKFRGFLFEAYWLKMSGFQEVVQQAWSRPIQATDSIRRLHIKLARTVRALKNWEKNNIKNIKRQLALIKEVVWQLDQVQERRALTHSELGFWDRLKGIYLGLLAIEKVRARQRSWLTNIKHEDANSKLFYLRANGRKRKKHIQIFQTLHGLALSQEDKEKEVARHFESLLGTKHYWGIALNWSELGYPRFNLAELEVNIIAEDVKKAIADMPKENAPGPDGLICAFCTKYWDIVKSNVIQAVHQLSQLRGNTFNLLNTANIVLLPKKERVECIGDYKPISLVHCVAKIFSKILATRLAPRLHEMVSSNQSAFIKKRCIHNNFICVQSIAKELHRKRTLTLFLKLDITKAFDSVSWAYLLEVLERNGFWHKVERLDQFNPVHLFLLSSVEWNPGVTN
jgi:hypothetical protein